jgi:hypothetical protein
MKYPLNTEKVILALETESHAKMAPKLKELWECLVPLSNDAYEYGRCGKAYSAEWVKKWSDHFGSEPDPKTKLLLEKVDQLMTNSYEEGKRDGSLQVPCISVQKGGVPA